MEYEFWHFMRPPALHCQPIDCVFGRIFAVLAGELLNNWIFILMKD